MYQVLLIPAEVIDSDVYRNTLQGLGFSTADRRENIRRLAKVADSYREKGILAIIAAINPFVDVRTELCESWGAKTIWIRCGLHQLIQRDTKGLYKKLLIKNCSCIFFSKFLGSRNYGGYSKGRPDYNRGRGANQIRISRN